MEADSCFLPGFEILRRSFGRRLRELESIICAYPSQAWIQDFIIGRLWMIGSMLYCNKKEGDEFLHMIKYATSVRWPLVKALLNLQVSRSTEKRQHLWKT